MTNNGTEPAILTAVKILAEAELLKIALLEICESKDWGYNVYYSKSGPERVQIEITGASGWIVAEETRPTYNEAAAAVLLEVT